MMASDVTALPEIARTAEFPGGPEILGRAVHSALEAHDMLQRGLSALAECELVETHLTRLDYGVYA